MRSCDPVTIFELIFFISFSVTVPNEVGTETIHHLRTLSSDSLCRVQSVFISSYSFFISFSKNIYSVKVREWFSWSIANLALALQKNKFPRNDFHEIVLNLTMNR